MLNYIKRNRGAQTAALVLLGILFVVFYTTWGGNEVAYEDSVEKLKSEVSQSKSHERKTKEDLDSTSKKLDSTKEKLDAAHKELADAKEEMKMLRVELEGFAEIREKLKPCAYEFVSYTSSQMEQEWIDNLGDENWNRNPCSQYQPFADRAQKWAKYTVPTMMEPPASSEYDSTIFSTFLYKDCKGNELRIPIEPMAIAVRHPLLCTDVGRYVLDKDYQVISWEAQKMHEAAGNPSIYYFDLGASTWDEGGGGPSQSWFTKIYEKRGMTFDDMYMWEVTVHDPNVVFGKLPGKYMPVYHWFNIPASPEPGHKANPYTTLLDRAKPEDFVVYKLDIDTPSVELPLVQQILNNKTIAGLIDEMYFEHHVNFYPMTMYWGTGSDPTSLKDTFDIFLKLRNLGIRAHSWV